MASLDFSDLLSVVQTAGIIVALLLTVYFSRRQIEAFTADLESRVLNDIDEKFHRIGEIFIERPELVRAIYNSGEPAGPEVPLTYYVVFFCSHIFHMREGGLLRDNEWLGWRQWMRKSFQQGTIGSSWKKEGVRDWVDPAFAAFVDRELLGTPLDPNEAGSGPAGPGATPRS